MTGETNAQDGIVTEGSLTSDQAAVREACTAFRAALERTTPRPVGLEGFPNGACGDTSELLADFLRSSGLGDPLFVSGRNGDHTSTHAWLELGDLIVDITADQFEDIEDRIIVTTDRNWYEARFPSVVSHRPAGLAHWDGPTHAEVARYYSRVAQVLDHG